MMTTVFKRRINFNPKFKNCLYYLHNCIIELENKITGKYNTIIHTYIHIYIYNWSLQPFSQVYDLASYTTFDMCAKFIQEWRYIPTV